MCDGITIGGNVSIQISGPGGLLASGATAGATTQQQIFTTGVGVGASPREIQLGGTSGVFTNVAFFTDLTSLNAAINFSRPSDGGFTESVFAYQGSNGLSNLGVVSRGNIKLVAGGIADQGMTLRGDGTVDMGLINSLNFSVYAQQRVVIGGDSLSGFATTRWPYYLAAKSPELKFATQVNCAVPGATTAAMVASYAATVHTARPTAAGDKCYFFIMGGINDLVSSETPANIYNNLKSLWASGKTDGYIVVAFTVMHSTALTGSQEADRLVLNNLILSDQSLYDYVVRPDLTLNPITDGDMFEDATHTNAIGAAMLAVVIEKTLFNTQKAFTLYSTSGNRNPPATFNLQLNPTGGNVGIGTAIPGALFEVSTATNAGSLIGDQTHLAGSSLGLSNISSGIAFRRSSDGGAVNGIFLFNDTGGTPDMGLRARNDIAFFNSTTQNVTIKQDGNVGIQTIVPTAALHVPGSTTARASLRVPDGVAPSAPNDGDIWAVSGHLYARLGGVTKEFTLV